MDGARAADACAPARAAGTAQCRYVSGAQMPYAFMDVGSTLSPLVYTALALAFVRPPRRLLPRAAASVLLLRLRVACMHGPPF